MGEEEVGAAGGAILRHFYIADSGAEQVALVGGGEVEVTTDHRRRTAAGEQVVLGESFVVCGLCSLVWQRSEQSLRVRKRLPHRGNYVFADLIATWPDARPHGGDQVGRVAAEFGTHGPHQRPR